MRTNLSLELTSPSTSMHLRIYQQRKTSAHHLGPWKVLGESFTVEMLTIVAWASPSSTYLLSSISQFHHHQFDHHCVISKTYRVGGDHIQALGSYLGPWSHFSQDEMNTRNVSSWNCGWYPHNSSVACLLDRPTCKWSSQGHGRRMVDVRRDLGRRGAGSRLGPDKDKDEPNQHDNHHHLDH